MIRTARRERKCTGLGMLYSGSTTIVFTFIHFVIAGNSRLEACKVSLIGGVIREQRWRRYIVTVPIFNASPSLRITSLVHLDTHPRCAPLSLPVLMSAVPQIYLPPELVHAVLMRMEDWGKNGQIKRGLASCSLACRYWATLIRPLLFEEITLRSGEDVSQLVASLDADFLQPALSNCIEYINVVEDQTLAVPLWSHQLMRLAPRIPLASIWQWNVEDAPAASNDQSPQKPASRLPFSALPKTLPPSALPRVHFLTLSGLALRSLRELARFVGNQICEELVLDSVTFAEESADEIQLRRVPASWSKLVSIHISHGLLDRDAILYWIKTCHIPFASQGHERLDSDTLELAVNYLYLLISHPGRQDQILHLRFLKETTKNSTCFRASSG